MSLKRLSLNQEIIIYLIRKQNEPCRWELRVTRLETNCGRKQSLQSNVHLLKSRVSVIQPSVLSSLFIFLHFSPYFWSGWHATINPRAFPLLLLGPNGTQAPKLLRENLREPWDCAAIDARESGICVALSSLVCFICRWLPCLKEEYTIIQATSETLVQVLFHVEYCFCFSYYSFPSSFSTQLILSSAAK